MISLRKNIARLRSRLASSSDGDPEMPDAPDLDPHRDIVRAIRAGDAAAYSELAARFAPKLRTFLRRLVRDPALADELALETLSSAFQRTGECRDSTTFSVWIFRIARNRALDHLRAAASRERAHDEARRRSPESDARTPLRLLEDRELESRIEAALAELDEPFRTVFLLREQEGLSYEAIAEITGVLPKTVSTRLVRARLWLRAQLLGYLRGDLRASEGSTEGDADERE